MWKKIATVGFALVTGLGWQWTAYLSRQNLLTSEQQLFFASALTVFFFLQQVYLVFPEPVPIAKARQRAQVIEGYLRGLLVDYEKFVRDYLGLAQGDAAPVIRINVMLLARRFRIFKRLRIVYTACPNGLSYSGDELKLRWRRAQGIVGAAWSNGQPVIYDSKDASLNGAAGTRSPKQREITDTLNSVYAVPLLSASTVVGILNLDSQSNIDKTAFNHAFVTALASNYAGALVPFCFEEGVEA